MNSYASYIPSAILFCAFILLLLVSISLPTIDDLDIARLRSSVDFLKDFAQIRVSSRSKSLSELIADV